MTEEEKLKRAIERALDDYSDHVEDLEKDLEQANITINHYEKQVNHYEEQVNQLNDTIEQLEDENKNLMEYIDELKIDLLKAQKVIDESQHQSLNNMYFSPDSDNRVVAKEVINNLYKDE